MAKIKRKVEMTPKELIKWAFENDIKNESYETYNDCGNCIKIHFDYNGFPILSYGIYREYTFTVEIEEEIDENTVLPKLVYINKNTQNNVGINFNCSINRYEDRDDYNYYHLNEDGTMTLLWKDGAMVE